MRIWRDRQSDESDFLSSFFYKTSLQNSKQSIKSKNSLNLK